MKHILLFIFICLAIQTMAQTTYGSIYPGESYTNNTCDTLFYLSKQKIEKLIKKQEILENLVINYELRNEICDSLLLQKKIESERWYAALLTLENQLKDSEIKNATQEDLCRRRKKGWLGIGLLGGLLLNFLI